MCREIPLNKGLVTLVDESDFDLVLPFCWHAQPHRRTFYATENHGPRAARKRQKMHRLIMGARRGQQVDHIDGDGLNNRRDNLRFCTNSQNQMNSIKRRGASKYKGVSFAKKSAAARPWKAQIKAGQICRCLGFFGTEEEAALAYDSAARDLHGPFGRLNFPLPNELSALNRDLPAH